jgi:hypothetical protein
MKCNVIDVSMGLFLSLCLLLTGCGGGGPAASSAPNGTANTLITSVGWIYENAAPDYSNNGPTSFLSVKVYYSESIASADIDSFAVAAPNGWQWTIMASNSQLGTSSSGKPYIGGNIYYGANPHMMPLAGTWVFQLKLKNGQISSVQKTFHEPGSAADATHQYLYSAEDWTPPTDSSQYITALRRLPSLDYTIQYDSANGGMITSAGLSAVRDSYLIAESHAYNMLCWLYDANKQYLGYTITEYSTVDHSLNNLIKDNGELFIMPASTVSSNGQVDLSAVKYLRFVYYDGSQYQPSSYSNADYRSISSLISVNDTHVTPLVIASGLDLPSSVAVDDNSVYFSQYGAVMKVDKLSGSVITLASGLNAPLSVKLDSMNVYWVEYYGFAVKKVGKNGGTATTLGTSGNCSSIALSDTNVFWPYNGITTVAKSGGNPSVIVSPLQVFGAYLLVVDSTNVYWTEYGIAGSVKKAGINDGIVTTLASNVDYAGPIAVDSTDVYWINGGALKKIGKNGGAITTLAEADGYDLAMDSVFVYYIRSGQLRKIPKQGGQYTTLASVNVINYCGIAVDDSHVYWSEWGTASNNGYIKAVPKN